MKTVVCPILLEPHGDVDVYAYFKDRESELVFERAFSGQNVRVESSDWSFTPTMGVGIRDVEWAIQDA